MGAPSIEIRVGERLVRVSNPDKVYFPQPGYTKRQVVEYFVAVGEGILRATRDRPTTLERWYNVSIVFESDLIKGCRINGKYTDQSLESVLQSIRYMYKIDFEFKPNNIIHLKGTGCRDDVMDTS